MKRRPIRVLIGRPADLSGPAASTLSQLARSRRRVEAIVPVESRHCVPTGIHPVAEIDWTRAVTHASERRRLGELLQRGAQGGRPPLAVALDPLSSLALARTRHRPAIRFAEGEGPYARAKGFRAALGYLALRWSNRLFQTTITSAECPATPSQATFPGWGVDPIVIRGGRRAQLRSLMGVDGSQLLVGTPCTFREPEPIDLMIDLAHAVEARALPVRLVVIGSGPLESDARQQVRDAGLSGRLTFAGARPLDHDLDVSMDAGLLIDPRSANRHRIAVAMASGVPCLSLDFEGCPGPVSEPEARATADARAIADLIEHVMRTDTLATIGARQRERVLATRSTEMVAEALGAVFDRIDSA